MVEAHGRGLQLTAAGGILLEHADELYSRWEEIRAELLATDPALIGTLRLCGFSTAVAALLPQVAARVRAVHPRCTVRIIEADPDECFDLLLAGQADIAVVVAISSLPPRSDPRFDQASLLEDPLDLLVPDEHPLAGRAPVRRRVSRPWSPTRSPSGMPARPWSMRVLGCR